MKNSKNPELTKIIDKIMYIGMGFAFATILILYFVSIGTQSFMVENNDIKNWVSLGIEATFGIFITIVVVIYSNYQQRKMKELVDGIHNMERSQIAMEQKMLNVIEQQEQYRKSRYEFESDALRFYLDLLYDRLVVLETYVANESRINKEIQELIDSIKHIVGNLKAETQRSVGIIEHDILENIDEICWYAKQSPKMEEIDGIKKLCTDESNNFLAINSFIESVLAKLPKTKNLFPPK